MKVLIGIVGFFLMFAGWTHMSLTIGHIGLSDPQRIAHVIIGALTVVVGITILLREKAKTLSSDG